MILFLTSSPSGPLNQPNPGILDESNGFVDQLKQYWKENMKGLMVVSDPFNQEGNLEMTDFFTRAFHHSGLPIFFDICNEKPMHLKDYDLIMLAGGHVPTQNAFLTKIDLRKQLENYEGIVIGVSAGSMNCAHQVYVQPEEENESALPLSQRLIPGLNLTHISICPHYQMYKNAFLDGKRLYEDIIYKDSYDHFFIALNDGSYILSDSKSIRIFGEAYAIFEGQCIKLNDDGQILDYLIKG